jgi:hypothetical protein
MSVPRVLLLRGGPYGLDAGEVFLQDLCSHYPQGRLCQFSVLRHTHNALPKKWLGFPTSYAYQSRVMGLRRLGRISAWLTSFPLHQYIRRVCVPDLTVRAVRFARLQRVELVWAVLNDPTLVYLARRVATRLNVPLVVTIWDPPEYLAMNLDLDPVTTRILLREFAHTLRSAARRGVASEGMQSEYRRQYGVDSVVMIHGIHPKLRHPAATGPTEGNQFIIGFAGSMYTDREWQALLGALSSINWCLAGRDITLQVLGSTIRLQVQGKMRIEYLGWRPLEETVQLMSQVDVTYLPYWFNERYRLAVRLCFPNKLTTYLAAGRPVLFHGPEDSSPARFFHRFPVGVCCHSLEESQIIESLMRLALDHGFYASATQAGQLALDEELSLSIFLRRFSRLIDINEDELLAESRYTLSTKAEAFQYAGLGGS